MPPIPSLHTCGSPRHWRASSICCHWWAGCHSSKPPGKTARGCYRKPSSDAPDVFHGLILPSPWTPVQAIQTKQLSSVPAPELLDAKSFLQGATPKTMGTLTLSLGHKEKSWSELETTKSGPGALWPSELTSWVSKIFLPWLLALILYHCLSSSGLHYHLAMMSSRPDAMVSSLISPSHLCREQLVPSNVNDRLCLAITDPLGGLMCLARYGPLPSSCWDLNEHLTIFNSRTFCHPGDLVRTLHPLPCS